MNRTRPDWILLNQIEDLKRDLERAECERDLLRVQNDMLMKRIHRLERGRDG